MREALPHALLLHGPPGIGKSALSEVFAAALLCEQPDADGRACGGCAACGWFAQGNHPDVRVLAPGGDDEEGKEKASREIKIAQVRALAGFLSVGAHRGGRKVVIVDPADALNVPAANALLKTLEEPPGDTVFLLVTGRADALPATIRSRCVALGLPMPTIEVARTWLVERLAGSDPEDAPVPAADADTGMRKPARGAIAARPAARPRAEDVDAWLAASAGSPLRALALAEPARAASHGLAVETLTRIPGQSALSGAEALAAIAPRDWLPILQAWLSDLGRVLAGARPRRYPAQHERLSALARSTTLAQVTAFEGWLRQQLPATEHPLNPRLFCEDTLLRYEAIFGQGAGTNR